MKEVLRIIDYGDGLLDIRWWKEARNGDRMPTKRALAIKREMLVPLIRALQTTHQNIEAMKAREEQRLKIRT